ncbi:MAG: hypothetical protein J6Z43_07260 [Clostridiales bacterium]|nr:hypothetical protein [Clostridiales bacterium]
MYNEEDKKMTIDDLEQVTGGVDVMPATPTEAFVKEFVRNKKRRGKTQDQIIAELKKTYGKQSQLMSWIEGLVKFYYNKYDKNGVYIG